MIAIPSLAAARCTACRALPRFSRWPELSYSSSARTERLLASASPGACVRGAVVLAGRYGGGSEPTGHSAPLLTSSDLKDTVNTLSVANHTGSKARCYFIKKI